jgi:hypothetical protein
VISKISSSFNNVDSWDPTVRDIISLVFYEEVCQNPSKQPHPFGNNKADEGGRHIRRWVVRDDTSEQAQRDNISSVWVFRVADEPALVFVQRVATGVLTLKIMKERTRFFGIAVGRRGLLPQSGKETGR